MNSSNTITETESYKVLLSLYEKAFNTSAFNALCTLLRVSGIEDANWDPFEESRNAFADYNWLLKKAGERSVTCSNRMALLMYCQAIEMTAPHEIMINLLRCSNGEHYLVDPFFEMRREKKVEQISYVPTIDITKYKTYAELKKASEKIKPYNSCKKMVNDKFSYTPPSATKKLTAIIKKAKETGQEDLSRIIESFFDAEVRNSFSHSDYILTDSGYRFTEGGHAKEIAKEVLDTKITECFEFYSAFINLHREWLRALARGKKLHKWPDYETLEILSSDIEGVFGFNLHFSNGTKATFTRRKSGTESINIYFCEDGGVGFWRGDSTALDECWKIDGKPVDDWNFLFDVPDTDIE